MIVLNGGSYYPVSEKIDKEWIKYLGKEDLIGFVPSATVKSEEEYLIFFKKQMANYGLNNIASIDLYNNWDMALEVKVLFIAGGNTYKLLNIMKKSGFSDFIIKNHKNKIIVGNSAGAVVLGEDIKSSNSKDIIGLSNTKGLGLVKYSICPHYTKEKSRRLEKLSMEFNQKIIGIPESSAIIIDDNGERVINEINIFQQ